LHEDNYYCRVEQCSCINTCICKHLACCKLICSVKLVAASALNYFMVLWWQPLNGFQNNQLSAKLTNLACHLRCHHVIVGHVTVKLQHVTLAVFFLVFSTAYICYCLCSNQHHKLHLEVNYAVEAKTFCNVCVVIISYTPSDIVLLKDHIS